MHLVGYLYYWQMGFNSVFKGLTIEWSYYVHGTNAISMYWGLQSLKLWYSMFTILCTRCSTVSSDSVNTSYRTYSCLNYDDQSRSEITQELSVTHKKDTGLDRRDRVSYLLQGKHTGPMKMSLTLQNIVCFWTHTIPLTNYTLKLSQYFHRRCYIWQFSRSSFISCFQAEFCVQTG